MVWLVLVIDEEVLMMAYIYINVLQNAGWTMSVTTADAQQPMCSAVQILSDAVVEERYSCTLTMTYTTCVC